MANARSTLFSLSLAAATLLAREASADEGDEPYFYKGYDYGTQALYNPAYVFVNRGFDVLQTRVDSRNVFRLEYRQNAGNVMNSLTNPFPAIASDTWSRFLREEIFPLTWTAHNARWTPNYTLHLIGGGMTYTQLREWFEAHQWPAPQALSVVTVLGTALMNETIENKGVIGPNTDCIADFYFFDIGGIVLFSFAPANVFFSKYLVVADWSPPPAIVFPGTNLHNHGNYFSAKYPLPFFPRLRLFSYFGLATTGGLSYKFDGEYSISASAGLRSARLTGEATNEVRNDVSFASTGGVFLDRNNSLLASVIIANVPDYFLNVNLMPGLVRAVPGLGLWAVFDKAMHPMFGISTTLGFGTGVGPVK